jgi:hypothetical protein
MKYYCYNEYDPESPLADEEGGYVKVMSEDEILHQYWPYWYERMCKRYGKEHVDKNYGFHECLDDWIVVNMAWESK